MFNLKIILLFSLLIITTTSILVEGQPVAEECTLVEDLSTHPTLKITLTTKPFDEGSFGKIFRTERGDKVIKRVELKDQDMVIPLLGEIKAMEALSGVVGMVGLDKDEGCYYNGEHVYLIMPFFQADIAKFLTSKSNKTGYAVAHSYVWKLYASNYIVNLVVHLHSMNWLHLDLKIDNILIEDIFSLYLTDFGFASQVDPVSEEDQYPYIEKDIASGTLQFAAPEIFSTYKYYRETDIYALAVVLLQIWYIRDVNTYQYLDKPINVKMQFLSCKNKTFNKNDISMLMFCTFIYPVITKMYRTNLEDRIIGNKLLESFKQAMINAINYLNEQVAAINQMIEQNPNDNIESLANSKNKRDINSFIEAFVGMKAKNMNENQPLKEFMLKTNAVFFEARADKGAGILGFTIDDYVNAVIDPNTPIQIPEEERLII